VIEYGDGMTILGELILCRFDLPGGIPKLFIQFVSSLTARELGVVRRMAAKFISIRCRDG
jgi:hypothetical protein